MRNLLTSQQGILHAFSLQALFRLKRKPLLCLLTLGLTLGWGSLQPTIVHGTTPPVLQAASPETAPPELSNLLAQLDTAANNRDLKAVMQFYGRNFTHTDGLNRRSLEQALNQLWEQYPRLNYRTELKSWKRDGNAIVAETTTQITGATQLNGRDAILDSTIQSQQRIENQKIVRQEILSERTEVKAGENPPEVNINLPAEVRVGQEYSFDAIVKQPLGDSILLGGAVEEPVRANNYLKPESVSLEVLPAGGIYKLGRAPSTPDSRWISAVLVREDGMTMITQRLRVVERSRSGK